MTFGVVANHQAITMAAAIANSNTALLLWGAGLTTRLLHPAGSAAGSPRWRIKCCRVDNPTLNLVITV